MGENLRPTFGTKRKDETPKLLHQVSSAIELQLLSVRRNPTVPIHHASPIVWGSSKRRDRHTAIALPKTSGAQLSNQALRNAETNHAGVALPIALRAGWAM